LTIAQQRGHQQDRRPNDSRAETPVPPAAYSCIPGVHLQVLLDFRRLNVLHGSLRNMDEILTVGNKQFPVVRANAGAVWRDGPLSHTR
jgi:hypothetical protein